MRYLGLLVPAVAGLPSALAGVYLLLHPREMIENRPGAALTFVIFAVASFGAIRWMHIGASIGDEETVFRGLLATVRVKNVLVGKISKVWKTRYRLLESNQKRSCFVILDVDGSELAEIPGSVEMCPGFGQFVSHLQKVARELRSELKSIPPGSTRGNSP